MKNLLIVILVVALGYFGWKAIQTKPDPSVPAATVSDVVLDDSAAGGQLMVGAGADETDTPTDISGKAVDNAAVTVSFKGFGPGKEHYGSFSDVRSALALTPAGDLSGSVVVGMASLKTENDKVTTHLKTKDFFDVTKYPTATFKLASVVDGKATGSFTIHGVTKSITFPVTITEAQMSSTFTLNLKDFGISQTFANETIELSVVVPIK